MSCYHMFMRQRTYDVFHWSLAGTILIAGILGFVYIIKTYPQVFSVSAAIENRGDIELTQPVAVSFSDPVIPETIEKRLSVFPDSDFHVSWQDSNRKLVIVPESGWKPETFYEININGGRSMMFSEINARFYFETTAYPKVEKIYPENGAKDVVMDIEDPIAIIFDKPIDEYAVKFALDPFEEVSYQTDSSRNEVKLMAKGGFKKGQHYLLQIFIRQRGEGEYRKMFETSFDIKPETPVAWEKDFASRLDQAKRFTAPAIAEGKYIDINIESQVMTLFENGKAGDSFLISSGKAGMRTPVMTTRIYNKFPRAWSKEYGLFMPFWMAILPTGKVGIHELPEWPNGYKEGANHLGIPVSHGCVRLGVGPAEKVYNWADIGTPVVVHE